MLIERSTNNGVTTITLNRPEKLNAFAGSMREELLDAIKAAESDDDALVVVITGAGRAFCAGGDVEYMAGLQRDRNVDAFRKLLDAGAAIVTAITSMSKPVIASINGVAAGAGCNLALACDIRIAADSAKLAQTFVRIGMHPDWGGTWLLPRIVGPGRAAELLMTGRMVDAGEALRIGLVDRVVAADQLAAETTSLAQSIADGPPLAIAAIKRALTASRTNSLAEQLELEKRHQSAAFESSDAAEGMAAFFEKRAPSFQGR
jgi:2-(1,2-epoxy-1,2-dihydrophenyl)acetyl-CoA isomerase